MTLVERTYTVKGSTATALAAAMDAAGPGKTWGATSWGIDWMFGRKGSSPCQAVDERVRIAIEVVLPRWERPASAKPEVVRRWRTFIAALKRHEYGHVENDLRGANRVEAMLRSLGTYPTCVSLQAKADAAGERIVAETKAKNERYDRTTEHGRTQGATLP